AVNHLNDFYNWKEDDFIRLEDVGPKVAASVSDFFGLSETRHIIDKLERRGVNLSNHHKKEESTDGTFAGKTFLFTGTLHHFKRSDAEALVEEKGGTIVSGVSSKLHYLVV